MPIRTLRDLDLLEGSSSSNNNNNKNSSHGPPVTGSNHRPTTIHHIPVLPDSTATLAMLRRIHQEFLPIIQRRGYKVLSISEMCCCGDGLDYETKQPNNSNASTRPNNNVARKKGRTRRIMASNILGYNQTRGSVHTIHLRLRDAQHHHRMFCYEDVAGTMAHELAHCEHGAHDAKFYKLMDEILEQHAVLLARGFVADKDGFPMNSAQTYVLGRGATLAAGAAAGNNIPVAATAAVAARAAEQRRRRNQWMPQGPQMLGGDNEFRRLLGPQEAAGMAAEMRRLRDEQWCQPCENGNNQQLSDEDEDDEYDNEKEMESKPNAASSNAGTKRKSGLIILDSDGDLKPRAKPDDSFVDLTGIDSDDDEATLVTEIDNQTTITAAAHNDVQQWSCSQCTYSNRPLALMCDVCHSPRFSQVDNELVARALLVADEVEHVKDEEVRRSEEQFGFNIYGTSDRKTKTMKHLT